jgi:hypothetical protein
MRPKKVTVSSVAASAWLPVDYKQDPMNLGVGCVLVSGTATYSVEYTFDDVFDATVTPVAFALSTITAATTSKDGVINTPVRAIRLNVTAGASPVVSMTMIQGLR